MTKYEGELRKLQAEHGEEIYDFIKQDFLRELRRVGATDKGTHANYLQAVRKILQFTENLDILKIQDLETSELREICETVADNIQKSNYRFSEGENSERRKRNQWTAWKRLLEASGIKADKTQDHIPRVKFTSNEKVDRQANTQPEDLPTPHQMREFVKQLGKKGNNTALRNQALAMLLWDKGPRIGEALQIRIGDIKTVEDSFTELQIPGNKGAENRTVKIFQGAKIMKDWLEQHPASDKPDAYLFCNIHHSKPFKQLTKSGLKNAWFQAHHEADLDFKLKGEPFHIFRKAMVTFHIVNGYATWEDVSTWHGTSVNRKKPDYLKMALTDVDAKVAEELGVDLEQTGETNHRMLGEPLTPMKCTGVNCGRLNTCIESTCRFCGRHLPDSTLPQADEQGESDSVDRNLAARIAEELAENPDKTLNEIAEDMKDDG